MPLLIKNIRAIGTGPVEILIDKGVIAALRRQGDPLPEEDPSADGANEILDGQGMLAAPGMVNGHTHAAMTLLRGVGGDLPLKTWLEERIWPIEARMSKADIRCGVKLACLEMIRSGTTRFFDGYWHFHEVAQAIEEMGLRASVACPLLDAAGPEMGDQLQRETVERWDEISRYGERIAYHHAPHAIYSVEEPRLSWLAQFSADHQTPVHIHLAETARETTDCIDRHGVRPAFYLDRLGLLTPRAFLAHGVHLDESELDLIAERDATLITCPASNMKLGVGGVFPYPGVRDRGIPFGLGTDGAASNNSLDLFQEMKILGLLQKHAHGAPTLLPAAEILAAATGARAPALGASGRLAAGEPADLILLNLDAVETTPEHDPVDNLVYAATGAVVDTVIVAGRILMRGRRIDGEAEIRQEATERARALVES